MKITHSPWQLSCRTVFIAAICIVASMPAAAQMNVWTNPTSGKWQDSAWSLGVLPGAGQDIELTNAGWKALAIDPSTVSAFPDSLTINSITIDSPTDSFNVLLLNYTGTETPLTVGGSGHPGSVTVHSGSSVVMLSSALKVQNSLAPDGSEQGSFNVGGTFTEGGGSEVSAAFLDVPGTYTLTNSVLLGGDEHVRGRFYQEGGTNFGNVILQLNGEYDLYEGAVAGRVAFEEPGFFIQRGGAVSGTVGIGSGLYELDDGLLTCSNLSIGADYPATYPYGGGDLVQNGGTNIAGDITMQLGPGSYSLSGGELSASSLAIRPFNGRYGMAADTFSQSGGYHTNGGIILAGAVGYGNLIVPASYNLSGGTLETPSIDVVMGAMNQTAGTNKIGTLTLSSASTYSLTNGWLIVSNLTQAGGQVLSQTGWVQQSGGTAQILGRLSVSNGATYELSGGLLLCDDIQITAGAVFKHDGGSLAGQDTVTLADGTWNEQANGTQLGQLRLANGENSFLLLPTSPCVLRFADTSGAPWANGAQLIVSNWAGALNGAGQHQIIFGNSASALTPEQLAQVHFSNPARLPAGTYPARILADGEIVPDSSGPVPPAMSLAMQADGTLKLTVNGSVGAHYEIDVSTNLQTWTPWTNAWNNNGSIVIVKGTVTNLPNRFYRVVVVP
ncbi:MAG TPA: hypothetical protein VFE51_06715 [Verrucomicrobiae bacterium]|nr:hypothetical protein [Verrucomicrobiae bacterium]